MGRSPCCSKVGLRKGPWSTKEDSLLANYIQTHGEGQWRSLPKKAGLLRCGKSCRLRWMNYLRPGIKRGNINQDEEDLIVRLHGLLGNRWSLIAGRLPGRTDNEIKNYWNTHLLKKLKSAADPKPSPKPKKSAAAADPKPSPKPKKSAAAKKKKNNSNKHKKSAAEAAAMPKKEVNTTSNEKLVVDEPPKTKVYLPKPIRVSPAFSRSSSYDSLASGSGASNSDASEKAAAEVVSYFPGAAWPPLFESNDADYVGGDCSDDFLSGGFILPILNHCDSISGDVNMLDKVYDEYLQLL